MLLTGFSPSAVTNYMNHYTMLSANSNTLRIKHYKGEIILQILDTELYDRHTLHTTVLSRCLNAY